MKCDKTARVGSRCMDHVAIHPTSLQEITQLRKENAELRTDLERLAELHFMPMMRDGKWGEYQAEMGDILAKYRKDGE